MRGIGSCVLWLSLVLVTGCQESDPQTQSDTGPTLADVVSVQSTGESGAYRFEVGVRSPDEGCHQYANWWEVVSEDGELIYRRVLLHSHISEQPFVRSGEPVPIGADTVVWVRAHMHPAGYGGAAFKGSVRTGFAAADLTDSFAAELIDELPQPPECAN